MAKYGIYHDKDLDGLMCGAILRDYFGSEIELIGWDYSYQENEQGLLDRIEEDSLVYMCDISLSKEGMEVLANKCDLIWIDHHKTAIDKIDTDNMLDHSLEVGVAACELTWRYIYGEDDLMPPLVSALGAYDVWNKERYEWEMYTLPVQVFCRTFFTNVEQLSIVIEYDTGQFAKEGLSMLAFEKGNLIATSRIGRIVEWNGYKTFITNSTVNPGRLADVVWEEYYEGVDLMVQYYKHERSVEEGDCNNWRYSLRSRGGSGVDCGRIAKKYGGGGHEGAGGFTWERLLNFDA